MPQEVFICHFEARYWSEIRAIRDKVFIEEQAVSPEEEFDEFENSARHFLAFHDGIPSGTARWRQTEKGVKLERFAVLHDMRGKGVGRLLVGQVLKDVFRELPEPGLIYLHAQVQAIPFYQACGFEAFGEEFSEAGIRHRKMRFIRSQPLDLD